MRIIDIGIENYKSLKNISLEPQLLTVITGPNASGKSNLSDALEFISEVYRHGLQVAVARKGGYENIAHRKKRRSKSPIRFRISVQLAGEEYYGRTTPPIFFAHSFEFRAISSSIRSGFEIEREEFEIQLCVEDRWRRFLTGNRSKKTTSISTGRKPKSTGDSFDHLYNSLRWLKQITEDEDYTRFADPTELLFLSIARFLGQFRTIVDSIAGIRVLQVSPTNSRQSGVPVPNPEMDRFGGNLPAVVDMLQRDYPDVWKMVLVSMRQILPQLREISVDYTHSKTLGLFFREDGIGRPWSVSEVSDGTIHSLALLVAVFDPRSTVIVVEEPENSVHPWIIRSLFSAFKSAARSKQMFVTTHSPIVLSCVKPEEVWIMWRAFLESEIARLDRLEPGINEIWESGSFTVFDFIDSGARREAVPPSPTIDK